jgi:hypothetical protein
MPTPTFTFSLALSALFLAGPLVRAQTVAGAAAAASATSTSGIVSLMGPDALVIQTENSAASVRYASSASTSFVDEAGAPVAREVVASGLPVTVYYVRDGERLFAERVVVHRVTTPPSAIEGATVIQRPVMVEKPVIVEKKVMVEKPVIVEKRGLAAPPVVEKKTTTTPTTPARKKEE